MYPSHFTVTSTTFQLPLHSGTRCTARTGYRISHLPQGFWYRYCSNAGGLVVLKASGHPDLPPFRERFWSKSEKSTLVMIFGDNVILDWWCDFWWWCDVTSITSGKSQEIPSKSVEVIRIIIQNTIFMNIHAQARLLAKYELITPNSLREGAIQKSISPRCSFRHDWGQNTRYR